MKVLKRTFLSMKCTFLLAVVVQVFDVVQLTGDTDSTTSDRGGGRDDIFSGYRFLVEPSDTVVVSSHSAILNCSVTTTNTATGGDDTSNTSPYTIDWIRNDDYINIQGDTRREKLANGSLYFSSIVHTYTDKPDEGVYQCVANIADVGSIVSRKATLQVAYISSEFLRAPSDLSVHVGDVAMLACEIQGAPSPTVHWYKDSHLLDTQHANYHVHQDGVLEISSVQRTDFGRYKCQATNSGATKSSRDAYLQQDQDQGRYQGVHPRFVMEPSDRLAVEGDSVSLYCGANGRDMQGRPPTITWLKDGVTIDTQSSSDSRFTIIGQGTLHIDGIKASDGGSYTCRATNQQESIDVDAALEVQVPPKFLVQPQNLAAHIKSDVEFECDVAGNPRPRIQWLKNGDKVIPSGYFQIVDGKNLRILGLVNSDEGLYQCTAENSVGNIQAAAQLLVLNTDTPLPPLPGAGAGAGAGGGSGSSAGVSSTVSPDSTAPAASSDGNSDDLRSSAPTNLAAAIVSTRFVTLSWDMPANTGSSEILAYSVYWRELGSSRERVTNTTNLEANIQHLNPATSYVFSVGAYNRYGPSIDLARITVSTQAEIHVPSAPVDLTVTILSPTALRASWSPPLEQHGTTIKKYRLHYYRIGEEESHIDIGGTTHTLSGLHKFTEYSVRVVAYNNNGAGASTEEVVARTYSDVPSMAPQNVSIEAESSTSLIVHWEPPPPDSCNGIITGYKIRYKKRNVRRSNTATTDANRRMYVLSGMQRDTEYSVRVQAMSVNGSGPASPWLSETTFAHDRDESDVPGRPSSLQVRALSTSIVVSWSPPNDDRMVRGYILGYGVGVPDVYEQVLEAKTRMHTIKNLQPSSMYVISLKAYNNIGPGMISYESVYTREAPTEEPMTPMSTPMGLKAIVLSSSTIVVTWTDSTLGRNQRITDNRYYTIRYKGATMKKAKFINSTDLNIHVDDLKPNTEYEFAVKVLKGRRQSPWSLLASNTTFEAAPSSAPRDLTPTTVENNPTWVMLSWQPPRHINGHVTGYLVFYTTDATQDDRDWVVEGVLGERLTTIIKNLQPSTTYFFKVQARNRKGYGPFSPTVVFETPRSDGTGGGQIELPDDYGRLPNNNWGTRSHLPGGGNGGYSTDDEQGGGDGGIPPYILWIVIGCIGGVTLIAALIVTVIMCKKRKAEKNRLRGQSGYKSGTSSTTKGEPPKHIKPPDLWIHDMELKNMVDKSGAGGSEAGDTPTGNEDTYSQKDTLPPRGTTPLMSDHEDDSRYRRPRGKPIMIPVDQPPPPREPIAMAIPNGHLMTSGGGGGGPACGGMYPPSHPYPMPHHYTTSTPRVNAADLSTSTGLQSPDSPSLHNQHAPIPYDQLHHTSPGGPGMGVSGHYSGPPSSGTPSGPPSVSGMSQGPYEPGSNKSLTRPGGHPLKSFSVPGPPCGSAPNTPTPKQHIVKPQQQQQPQIVAPHAVHPQPTSPYKRPNPPISTPIKPRQSPMQISMSGISPHNGAPDVTLHSDNNDSDLPKSYSQEELSAEMANLEGLMKDLNAITQQEFEC